MSKKEMAQRIAKLMANGDKAEEARIFQHQMKRTPAQVKESFGRQNSIASVTRAEIILHCQPYRLSK